MGTIDEAFAQLGRAHRLDDVGEVELGPLTPLLAKSGGGALRPALRGMLPGGVEGVVGHLHYLGGTAVGAPGDDEFRFNVAVTEVAESQAVVPRLFCERRKREIDVAHHGFSLDHEDVWTGSAALEGRYRVTTGPFQDKEWLRELFDPGFVEWLATGPPADFSFELAYGWLAGSIEEDEPDARRLTALCEATTRVAHRVREESAWGAPPR